MPNWCWNMFEVSGSSDAVDAFFGATTNKAGALQFARLVPLTDVPPSDAMTEPMRALMPSPALLQWGVRCDLVDGDEHEDDDAFPIKRTPGLLAWAFATPNSPPVRWMATVAPMFPKLRFVLSYDEPGNNFSGIHTWENGVIVHEWEGESTTFLPCSVPACDIQVDGYGYAWENNYEIPDGVFCDDHALESAVWHASQGHSGR